MKVKVFIFLTLMNVGIILAQKPYNMSMLAFSFLTGNDPRDGIVCKAAMQVAVDNVNKRSDFLERYNIQTIYKDEGANSNFAVKEGIAFKLGFNLDSKPLMSPVIVGPYFTNGCMRLAGTLHYLDTIAVATGCSSPITTANRVPFPNLHHMRLPGDVITYSRFLFVKEVGKWDRVAIITNAASYRDFIAAVTMWNLLIQNGVQVPWFESVIDMDDKPIASIKASDLRIILVETTVIDNLIKFLCAAHRGGITGPRYVMILQPSAIFDLSAKMPAMPTGCNRSVLLEQMKSSYFIGVAMFSTEDTGVNSLGYNKTQFDAVLMSTVNITNSGDFLIREVCHDTMLMSLLILNDTENNLRAINMSLADYGRNPGLISRAVNASASRSRFHGLRVGLQWYSPRLEFDDEPHGVYQWRQETNSYQHLYRVVHNASRKLDELASYSMELRKNPQWRTADGKPPKSFPGKIIDLKNSPHQFITFMRVFSILAFVLQTFGIIAGLCIVKESSILKFSNVALIIGCIFLDGAAIFFNEGNDNATNPFCVLRFLAAVLGVSFLNSGLTLKLVEMYARRFQLTTSKSVAATSFRFPSRSRLSNSNIGKSSTHDINRLSAVKTPTTSNSNTTGTLDPGTLEKIGIGVITVLSTGILATLIVWFSTDTPSSQLVSISGGPVMSLELDAYHNVTSYHCDSLNSKQWLGIVGILQAIMFIYSFCIVFAIRRRKIEGFNLHSTAYFNFASMLVVGVLLNFIFDKPISKSMTFSVISLFISVISSILTVGNSVVLSWKNKTGNMNRGTVEPVV